VALFQSPVQDRFSPPEPMFAVPKLFNVSIGCEIYLSSPPIDATRTRFPFLSAGWIEDSVKDFFADSDLRNPRKVLPFISLESFFQRGTLGEVLCTISSQWIKFHPTYARGLPSVARLVVLVSLLLPELSIFFLSRS